MSNALVCKDRGIFLRGFAMSGASSARQRERASKDIAQARVMFCSWRKSATAPCSCAYRLRGSLSELLNHLCCLGQSTMVLRQQGLSLAKATTFGLSVAYREEAWHVLHDRQSGLETDTQLALGVYLIADPCDRRPMLAMAAPGMPIHLSIHLDGHLWDSPVVKTLIDHFQGVSLDCMESRRLGAGAWLDEWERPVNPDCDTSIVRGACQILHECRELEVDVNSRGCRGTARFEPSFVDSASTVIRITDRERRHVVHADVNDPGFHLSRTKGSGLRLVVSA